MSSSFSTHQHHVNTDRTAGPEGMFGPNLSSTVGRTGRQVLRNEQIQTPCSRLFYIPTTIRFSHMEFLAQATPLAVMGLSFQPSQDLAPGGLSTEPAHFRMIYHTHTPNTATHRSITDCTSWQKLPPTPAEMHSLTPMASRFATSQQIAGFYFSVASSLNTTSPPRALVLHFRP